MAHEEVAPTRPASGRKPCRLFAPDALRGLIIVFMALDHANLLVAQKHSPGEYWGGAFPTYSDTLAFLTRFVTHFSAPGFFLLMGIGMALFARSRREEGWGKVRTSIHFVVRGAVLMILQLLVVNRAWEMSPGGWGIRFYFGVLFALGSAMVVGSVLVWLRPTLLLVLTAALLIGAELLVPDPSLWGSGMSVPVLVHLVPGGIAHPDGGAWLWSNYQMIHWLELVTLGLAFGHWLADDPRQAYGRAWRLGLACLAAFVVVRGLDGFGNIRPRMGDSWIDVLNPVKYPPSIAFTLLTTGVNLALLWLLSRAGKGVRRALVPLVVFGQAPLFFYVLHLFVFVAMGHLFAPDGTSIPKMFPFWLAGLAILYPLCLAFRRFKKRKPVHSLVRLF